MASKQRDEKDPGLLKSMLAGLWMSSKKEEEPPREPEHPEEPEDTPLPLMSGDPEDGGPPEEPVDENLLQAAGNPLYELYTRRRGLPVVMEETAVFHLSEFMDDGQAPDREKRSWLKSFERDARAILQKSRTDDVTPLDAVPLVKMSGDRMSAWVFILPPTVEGKTPTVDDLEKLLQSNSITHGVNHEVLAALCDEPRYFKLTQVAWGDPPIDGRDGEVVDHFRREFEIQLTVKDDNTIDYKDLGWLQTVEEGEVVCDILPPTDAQSGTNVRGDEVRGRNGRKAVPPKGQNTKMNEDETALVASIDGVISFLSGRFRVDPLLIVKGNVETAVGNLNVVGDVLINGDIQEGFTVEATGNITVQGMVEGAQVMAGGNVQVGRGMNGNSHGVIQAKGDVRCKFIENGTVTAGGCIVCDTIINSTISSDTAVEVKTGRGAIIGGSITALERIDALTIGNTTNRSIIINMGSTANFLREKHELELKRKEVADEIAELKKNIRFLEADSSQTPQMNKMLDDFRLKLTVQKMQLANIDRQLQVMNQKQTDNTKCRIRAEVIYPPAQITIGSFSKVLRQAAFNAVVYLKNGEVHVANI